MQPSWPSLVEYELFCKNAGLTRIDGEQLADFGLTVQIA
jgi:hypothetical protein